MCQPLEEVIKGHGGVLFLLFTGAGGDDEEASRAAAREVAGEQPATDQPLFMEVSLQSWTDTAATHGVHGVPAILVFRSGRLLLRRLGRTDPDQLRSLLAGK